MRGVLPILLWLAAVCQASRNKRKGPWRPQPKPEKFEGLGENLEDHMQGMFSWWCRDLLVQCLQGEKNLRSTPGWLRGDLEAEIAIDFNEPFDRLARCGPLVTDHIKFQLANIITRTEAYLHKQAPDQLEGLGAKENMKYARNQLRHPDYTCTPERSLSLWKAEGKWVPSEGPSESAPGVSQPPQGAVPSEPEKQRSNAFFGGSQRSNPAGKTQSTSAPGLCERLTTAVTLGVPSEDATRRWCDPKTNPVIRSFQSKPDKTGHGFGGGSRGVAPPGRLPLSPIGPR